MTGLETITRAARTETVRAMAKEIRTQRTSWKRIEAACQCPMPQYRSLAQDLAIGAVFNAFDSLAIDALQMGRLLDWIENWGSTFEEAK